MENIILEINPQFISLQKIPSQDFSIILDGKNCRMKFCCFSGYSYNWLTVDDIVINAGVMCHTNVKINQFKPKIFSGSLFFLNQSQDGSEPYYTGFNDKFKLLFLTAEQTTMMGGGYE